MRGNEHDAQSASDGISESEAMDKQSELRQLQRKIEILAQTNADRERLLFNEETDEARVLIDQKEKLASELDRIQKLQESLWGALRAKDRISRRSNKS